MKSIDERISEFCAYHRDGDGECNNVVLKAWADNHGLDFQQRYELAYFFSITYCAESAIILFLSKKQVFSHISDWVKQNKQFLVFQSDRKYIRMKDSFEKCLRGFENRSDGRIFLEEVSESGTILLSKAVPAVCSWELFGRFSAYVFIETFAALTGIPVENAKMDWKKNTTATSGIMNVYGLDNAAEAWDKTKKLLVPLEQLDIMLMKLQMAISISGGSTNVTEIETSLCAYRKFYKGSRYNGYYLDRMLEEIYKMQAKYPEISAELLEIRKANFQHKYLGEVSGWKKIRTEMKKLYKETGIVL